MSTVDRKGIIAQLRDSADSFDLLADRFRGKWLKVDDLGRVYWLLAGRRGGYLIAQITASGNPVGMTLTRETAEAATLGLLPTWEDAELVMPSMRSVLAEDFFNGRAQELRETADTVMTWGQGR
ncbi:TPA: hypothetical protein N2A14_002566 [Pseudomonas aeruginosa]|nr:hypothetical protein [Pseudomonas aeruginosa]